MRLLYIPLLFLSCVGGLHAQGPVCTVGSYPPCHDVIPDEKFTTYYCEWLQLSDGTHQIFPGRPVTIGAASFQGTGHHPHLGIPTPRPLIQFTPNNGTQVDGNGRALTRADGCVTWLTKLNGFAGSYLISQTGTIGGTALIQANAHYKSNNFIDSIGQLPQTPNMQPFTDYIDNFHSQTGLGVSDTFWTRVYMHASVGAVAAAFKLLTGQNLKVFRCGLTEGGKSDNDRGENFDILTGLWNNSIRGGEEHSSMNSCDVLNPAFNPAPGSPYDFGAADSLIDAIEIPNCGIGEFSPGAVGTDGAYSAEVDWEYWKTKKNIHMVCGPERKNLE